MWRMPKTTEAAGRGSREPTLTQQVRRAQLIDVTIELVADKGYAGVSLAGIAARAGITKPAVLYHFASKADVVRAAYEHVLASLTNEVAAAVEAAPPSGGPAAYVRSMIGHLGAHPSHTRMIIEALSHGEGERDTAARWRPLAEIIETARLARGLPSGDDEGTRTTALIIGGAIDAIVTERLHDPRYDTKAATEQFVGLIEGIS